MKKNCTLFLQIYNFLYIKYIPIHAVLFLQILHCWMQIQSDSDRTEQCTREGFNIDKKYIRRISQADFTIILYHTYLSIVSREQRVI